MVYFLWCIFLPAQTRNATNNNTMKLAKTPVPILRIV